MVTCPGNTETEMPQMYICYANSTLETFSFTDQKKKKKKVSCLSDATAFKQNFNQFQVHQDTAC